MEGREPPPRASHPFPNNPDLTKFWGTPVVKPFFRFSFAIVGFVTAYGMLQIYLSRNDTKLYGFIEIPKTKEEVDKKREIEEKFLNLKLRHDLHLTPKHDKFFGIDPITGRNLAYDEGIDFPVNVQTSEDYYKFGSKI